ncbi:hypothetical protein EDD27_6562 [Nonomuraea polychroma]|uniref:Uncharacterized protein n=1 Tax=Nonomuraea polychroma TaxID=46176 RepID=A0A438MDH4_9ACTN|nr:hypothetical protein [Nonomuraea polychroma]RVX43859.1 hypothetical protein EDD27_6562 [Nonomuraea polychroma]
MSGLGWTYMYDRGFPYRVGWSFYAHPVSKIKGLGDPPVAVSSLGASAAVTGLIAQTLLT